MLPKRRNFSVAVIEAHRSHAERKPEPADILLGERQLAY